MKVIRIDKKIIIICSRIKWGCRRWTRFIRNIRILRSMITSLIRNFRSSIPTLWKK